MKNLTPTMREALTKALTAHCQHNFLSADEFDALAALRDACPERPTLEDGIYEVPDGGGAYCLRYVRDGYHGMYRDLYGQPFDGGAPLPDDTSTWRRIDGPPAVTPEQIDAAARRIPDYTESQWAPLSEETRDYCRARARKILAAAGIEVSE